MPSGEPGAACAADDFSERPGRNTPLGQQTDGVFGVGGRYDGGHPDPHVEYVFHLVGVDRSETGKQAEHRLRAPACPVQVRIRSEEHTSELQSRENLVCRLLLEKKKKTET